MDENKKEILKALEDMEKRGNELAQKKRLAEERLKKHVKKVPAVSSQDKQKAASKEYTQKIWSEFKWQSKFGLCLFLLTLTVAFSLSREGKAGLLEYMIYILLIGGMISGKKGRY